MKKIIIAILSMIVAATSYGQGTINFANVGAGLNAPVSVGGATLSGAKYKAELLVGTSATSLSPVAGAAGDFSTGSGYFLGGTVTLTGFAAGTAPFFQVRAWDSSTGATYAAATTKGASTVFALTTAGGLGGGGQPPGPPALLLGLTSFSLTVIPEPSVIALALLGGSALLFRRRK